MYSIIKSSDDSNALQEALESRVPDIVQAIRTTENLIDIIRYIKNLDPWASNPLISKAIEGRIGDIATIIVSAATDYRYHVHIIIDRIAGLSVLCNSSEIHKAIDKAADTHIAAVEDDYIGELDLLLDRLAMYDCLAKHDRIQNTSAKVIDVIPWATRHITKSIRLLSSPKVLETILRFPESALIVLRERPDFEHDTRLAECVAQAMYEGFCSLMTPADAKRAHKHLWKFESIRKALLER